MNVTNKKKKGRFSKYLIAFIVAINVAFTVGILYVFLQTSSEPSTLITAWFAFTTVELWQLATIKKTKVKNKEDDTNV